MKKKKASALKAVSGHQNRTQTRKNTKGILESTFTQKAESGKGNPTENGKKTPKSKVGDAAKVKHKD